jgi:hypothetical protein
MGPRIGCRAMTASMILVGLLVADPISAQQGRPRISDERIIAGCIRKSAGGHAWLERTLWGLRDQERGWIGAEVLNRDGSHDLGPMQVNSQWVPRLAKLTGRPQVRVRMWLKHDACFNVDSARWIFLSGLAVSKDYWKAVGTYHSPTEWRARRYRSAVAGHMRRRYGRNALRGQ